jgi:hypothetical protein
LLANNPVLPDNFQDVMCGWRNMMGLLGGFKLVWCYFGFTAAIFPFVLGAKSSLQAIQPFVASCATDGEIPSKEREAVNQVALQFVQNAVGPVPSAAYATFSAEAKETVPSEQFVAGFQNQIKPMGPFKNVRVAHSYIAKLTGGTHEQRVLCGNISSGWVAVNARPGPAEAHVIVETQTVNNTVVFVVWLIVEQGSWRVQYVHFATAEMVGKSAGDLQKTAQAENHAGHDFNAFILYAAALQLTDRGPFFQLGIRPEIESALGSLKRPGLLDGQPPFSWKFGTSTFRVLNVGPIGVGGKIYLVVDQEVESWVDDKEVDKKNRELITAFGGAYPEYRDAFAGLVVRAHERGGSRGFGTVDDNQK